MDPSTFETISPSRYITFTFPHRHLLRVAVLDSPSSTSTSTSAVIAAVWVPQGRESDWIFSTYSGHLQLLLSPSTTPPQPPPLSRLIIVGNSPLYPRPTSYNSTVFPSPPKSIHQELAPLLLALTPKSYFGENGEIPEIPFLIFEDGVVKSSILEICEGPCVGEMLIENVELETVGAVNKGFMRRLRYKRMPNLVQTQMKIIPKNELVFEELDNVEFGLDNRVLAHSYLSPMVAGVSVVSSFLEGRMCDGFRPRALCLGVGGGALLGFLSIQLNFEVVGVEEDEVVLKVAKKYFGLESNELIRLCVGDGIKYVKKLANNIDEESKFDVVMVDLDSSDATMGVCAPPLEFVKKSVLKAARMILHEHGVLIINVIPSSESFYESLVSEFQVVFEELYEIDVGNGENFVLIATKSNVENALGTYKNTLLDKLKSVVSPSYIDSIRKITKTVGPKF
ncbi:hypothetical protein ACJIZ3_022814 [Penstemon smallii]|uniref:Methyltransferase-like protein 13 n=1 Tax=Penstemon smallii TaxID=265156 RepID=A0ABD3TP67_9LAMI